VKLRVLDLFSGIGGFSLGLERTGGFETVAFCENNAFCRHVLASHWPDVPVLGDITAVDVFPEADVITAGHPCQDISIANPDATGLSGPRSSLFWHAIRAIRMVRPKHVILENVAEMLGRGMGDVVGALACCGYDSEWDCLPAAAAGAHHHRNRVWVVAHPGRSGLPVPEQAGRVEPAKEIAHIRRSIAECPGRSPEPDVVRVVHGVPGRVDAIGALGNSVYPAIPEMIGRAILEAQR
jgi:DNA (cytosine-5)-methyltransferase 1